MGCPYGGIPHGGGGGTMPPGPYMSAPPCGAIIIGGPPDGTWSMSVPGGRPAGTAWAMPAGAN
jgi:hypothetical protein